MLYLGADHNGYFLKERLKRHLTKHGIAWTDRGAFQLRKSDDYVDFATGVARSLKADDLGLLLCGSGHGMVIAANKIRGIRAIMPLDPRSAQDGRRDDHANVLVLAAWEMSPERATRIFTMFLKTKPGRAQRYLRRLRKVRRLEQRR